MRDTIVCWYLRRYVKVDRQDAHKLLGVIMGGDKPRGITEVGKMELATVAIPRSDKLDVKHKRGIR